MGGSSSKAGATATRVARAMPKFGVSGERPPSTVSELQGKDDLLTKFKPTKVVEMSGTEARAAAKKMYDEQVPDMNPDILRQAIAMGPLLKSEQKHQKMVPDNSELVMNKSPRPLPKDRTRAVAMNSEVDTKKGMLTQTQLLALLERGSEASSSPGLAKSVVDDFHVSEDDAAVLLRYYRTPDVRSTRGVMTARWHWSPSERSKIEA